MPLEILVRRATVDDIPSVTNLFYNTIQTINKKDYSSLQIETWSAGRLNIEAWRKKIQEQHFLVAMDRDEIIGFSSLENTGYLDFMFVHRDHQGIGIGKKLLTELEKKASQLRLEKIFSEVSITARPFFERMGFIVDTENRKVLRGVDFLNYKMSKKLK